MKAIFMTSGGTAAIQKAYAGPVRLALRQQLDFLPDIQNTRDLAQRRDDLRQVEIIFSTWGMFALSEAEIQDYLPNLQAVFYAAGSVQCFAKPFLARKIRIFSAWAANAVPVAEYAAAQILLANKGFFQSAQRCKSVSRADAQAYVAGMPGNYGETVGIIGAGMIGRLVISLLKAYRLSIVVFDPFLAPERAAELGVAKCSLEDLFTRSLTISNHLANNAQTQGLLDYSLFSRMRDHATFINTGRGAQVVEEDLVRALQEVPARTAVLDVTWPEPAPAGHAFYTLDNVFLTPHIAGSINDEVARMGEYMAEEYAAMAAHQEVRYEVTIPMLVTMA